MNPEELQKLEDARECIRLILVFNQHLLKVVCNLKRRIEVLELEAEIQLPCED